PRPPRTQGRRRQKRRTAAAGCADAGQSGPRAGQDGRQRPRAPTARSRRSDEDGERAARQPRRHRRRDPRPRRDVGRGRRAAPRDSVKFIQRLREHPVPRYVGFFLMMVVALVAAAIVASLTIDLGPAVRAKAEVEGSRYIERPLHIGSLRIHLLTGNVLVENLTIDGVHPGDRPFFTASQIVVALDWIPAFAVKPDITIASIEMTDWNMLVEKW